MKIFILLLIATISISIIWVAATPLDFGGREYIGKDWNSISSADKEIHNVSGKGFAFKEKRGFITKSLQIDFCNENEKWRATGVKSTRKIVFFDTTLISDERYADEKSEIRYVGIWPFGRFRLAMRFIKYPISERG
ncbi:hypothetical protein [Burkholderia sp. LMG 13014]|uniref:hypothetical protein n=1 Tax=Burkholderia sp. LMG 13014 TaxID=2709306 RepID=UPI0019657236|nr:hypothetical protein [Burkholderia sp. LMG 13014]